MEKLKPCPFCGGKAGLTDVGNEGEFEDWIVECPSCHIAMLYHDDGCTSTKDEAVIAWNRRADSGMRKTNVFYEQFREKAEFIKQEIESLEKEIKYAPAGILPELKERIKLLSILRHQYLECAEKYSEQKR